MMQEKVGINYFWDSYAIIELGKNNTNYLNYLGKTITITIFNLAELYWNFLNEFGEHEANNLYEKYSKCLVSVTDEVLKEAIKFRKEHKKKDLSYTDCIGYIYAKKNNLIFLTGDKEFENLSNVEFIK